MLLYGLPLSRILRLTARDVTRHQDGQVCLRPGNPPVPVPAPFAWLVLDLAGTRTADGWLFTGRWPSQPMAYTTCTAAGGTWSRYATRRAGKAGSSWGG